jgi:hypothetical protein
MCWNSAMRITPFLHCAWLAAALLLAAPAARAYDEGGQAAGADAFLARATGSRITFLRDAEAQSLLKDCKAQRRFFVEDSAETCRCTGGEVSGRPASATEVSVRLECPAKYRASHAVLWLNREQVPPSRWTSSRASPDLAKRVLPRLDTVPDAAPGLSRKVKAKSIELWKHPASNWQVILVPTPPTADDTGCKFQPYQAFRLEGEAIEYLGATGDVVGISGRGAGKAPVLRSHSECDGISVGLRVLSPGLPELSWFAGH